MGEKEKAIIELEDYYFKVKIESYIAASDMADIIGVLIGLKPVMMGDFAEKEYRAYDQVLNKAISLYAPKTTKVLTKITKKRWLD